MSTVSNRDKNDGEYEEDEDDRWGGEEGHEEGGGYSEEGKGD